MFVTHKLRDWDDGSVVKVLAMQALGQEFRFPESMSRFGSHLQSLHWKGGVTESPQARLAARLDISVSLVQPRDVDGDCLFFSQPPRPE